MKFTKYGTPQKKKRFGSNHPSSVYRGPSRWSAVPNTIAVNTLSHRDLVYVRLLVLFSVCVRRSSAPTYRILIVHVFPLSFFVYMCSGWRCDHIHGGQRLEARRSGSDTLRYGESIRAVGIHTVADSTTTFLLQQAFRQSLHTQALSNTSGWVSSYISAPRPALFWKDDQSRKFRGA